MYKYNKSIGDRLFDVFNYTAMVLLIILFLYPLWHTLIISFSYPNFASSLGIKLFPMGGITIGAYREVFGSDIILIGYQNTIFRAAMGTVLTLLVTYCGAYSLSKKNLPFKNIITMFILITMFFSGGLIPSYLLINSLGLMGSRWALILPGLTGAWYLIIARNFIRTLPESLEESAFIDGAHPLTVVFKIMMPLSMPIIAVLALWTAVAHWNAWFDALIYVRAREKMVLQLVLRRMLIDQSEELMRSGALMETTAETTPATVKAATVMVSVVPIIMVYPFLQKYFVKGILVGSLKG